MLTILFWNLRKGNLAEVVATLAIENQVDILVLAENKLRPDELLPLLNPDLGCPFYFAPSPVQEEAKIDIYCAFAPEFLPARLDLPRATVRSVRLPGRTEFLLCGVHLQSKMYSEDLDQAMAARQLNEELRELEAKDGHSKTVVVGDLNMHPFDSGLTAANCFNAVMTRNIAEGRQREHAGAQHPFFFNPMWGLFGDGRAGPGGTLYYPPNKQPSIYWHMFDQVLVRPDLLPNFQQAGLRILTDYSGGRLVGKNGRPSVSDHLPILFTLDL